MESFIKNSVLLVLPLIFEVIDFFLLEGQPKHSESELNFFTALVVLQLFSIMLG